jgi:hypothetical protein
VTESQRRKCHERWQKRSRVVTFKGTGDGNWVVLLPHHMWLHLHWGHNKKYWNDQFQVFTGEGMILRRQLTIDCSENLSLSGVGFKDFLWKLEIDRSSIFYYDLSASEATCDEEVTRPSFHHRCLWMWRLVTVFATSRDTSAADSRSHGFNTRIVTRERIHKGLLMCMTVV